MNAADRTLEAIELIRVVKEDTPDEVDRLLEKNGILYNSEEDIDYQKNYGDDPTESED
jgi:hypothetical protein